MIKKRSSFIQPIKERTDIVYISCAKQNENDSNEISVNDVHCFCLKKDDKTFAFDLL